MVKSCVGLSKRHSNSVVVCLEFFFRKALTINVLIYSAYQRLKVFICTVDIYKALWLWFNVIEMDVDIYIGTPADTPPPICAFSVPVTCGFILLLPLECLKFWVSVGPRSETLEWRDSSLWSTTEWRSPANTIRWYNAVLMLAQRLYRWPNIKTS